MAYFVIKHIGPDGSIQEKPVEAVTEAEAISKSGLPSRNIQSVRNDQLGALKAALVEKRLPINEQILALVTIASKLEAGRTAGRAVEQSVDIEYLGLTSADLSSCERPSDYFKLLRFDETVILLAEAGDQAGTLSESLKRAADVLKEREKSRKEFAKPMRAAAINFTVGLAAGIGFPIFGGKMLHTFVYEQKFPISLNFMSHILIWLKDFYMAAWPFIAGLLVFTILYRGAVWMRVRRWPVLRFFDDRLRSKRGLEFIQTYQLLTRSGFTSNRVLRFMLERSSGINKLVYEESLSRNKEGRDLGEVFESEEWPKIISQNLADFDQQSIPARENILSVLTEALTEMYLQQSQKIASALGTFALLTIVSALLLFGLGFYAPMLTMRVSM